MTTTTDSNLQVVGAMYEAFGRGDLEALLSYVDPGVEWCQVEPGAYHAVLSVSRGTGHDAVRHYFGRVAEHVAFTKFAPRVMAASGDTVLSVIDVEFADPNVGKAVAATELHIFTLRDGLVVRYEPLLDSAATAPAFVA